MSYKEMYLHSINEKEEFWQQQAAVLPWFTRPVNILSQNEKGFHRWFADGIINMCYCCLDWQIEQGRGEQAALIYDSPVTQTIKKSNIYYEYNGVFTKLPTILRKSPSTTDLNVDMNKREYKTIINVKV